MPEGKKPIEAGDLGVEKTEIDGGDGVLKTGERTGREVGRVSDDTIDRILRSDEVETGDSTRELDLSAFREGGSGSS